MRDDIAHLLERLRGILISTGDEVVQVALPADQEHVVSPAMHGDATPGHVLGEESEAVEGRIAVQRPCQILFAKLYGHGVRSSTPDFLTCERCTGDPQHSHRRRFNKPKL